MYYRIVLSLVSYFTLASETPRTCGSARQRRASDKKKKWYQQWNFSEGKGFRERCKGLPCSAASFYPPTPLPLLPNFVVGNSLLPNLRLPNHFCLTPPYLMPACPLPLPARGMRKSAALECSSSIPLSGWISGTYVYFKYKVPLNRSRIRLHLRKKFVMLWAAFCVHNFQDLVKTKDERKI